ncbi:phenylacetic acid degradation protein PaaN [Roseateles sp. BYS180W]|uniref:Phenylacetic acid degradation protein PaaN n=1 Tax=Roseateles rivi TaxID=3299028 RepID=A0ABW7FT95_9BURK
MNFFAKHQALLERARQACRERGHWSPFPDTAADYPDAEQAQSAARERFEAQLGRPFALEQPGTVGELGEEVSPYTQAPLGIRYPRADPDALFAAAEAALPAWAEAGIETRIGVLMEAVDRLYREALFEIALAVQHTSGQSANMAYAGSGVNALDRAIEALVHAEDAMRAVPVQARWARRFGSANVVLDKRYRVVPRGVAVCFSCASFPTWNAWPSMLASLATGNPVIVKPHPAAVLPMALSVRLLRRVLTEAGFDPNLVTLALDSTAEPLGKVLVQHPATRIVDFTGSAQFGVWVEKNAHPAIVFTETSGCNTVVLESAADLDAALRALATTLCMFSGQMCTSPQNFYVPRQGVRTPSGLVSFDEVARRLAAAVQAIATEPRRAAMILAAIQAPQTVALLDELEARGAEVGEVLLGSHAYPHPAYPAARTRTPLLIRTDTRHRALYGQERFGPIGFVIACEDAADALAQATTDTREFGGLTAFLYSEDEAFIAAAEAAYARAGAQLTVNLIGPMPLNFAAAYSDYHVTGLNPAGNASLTEPNFVTSRFRIVQSRRPAAA